MRGLFSLARNAGWSSFISYTLKSFISVYILSCLILGCSQKLNEIELFNSLKENKLDLSTQYWNLVVEPQDSILAEHINESAYLKYSYLFFGESFVEKIRISGNKIVVSKTNKKSDWTGQIHDDSTSFSKTITIFFEGKILKATNDSLVIKKNSGTGIFSEQKEIYRFYNDRLRYDPDLELDTIEFSSTTCFGTCPAFAIKIDKGLNLYFWGGEYAIKEGFYRGKIKKSFFNKLQNMVRIARIEQFHGELGILVDGSSQEIIFDYNQSKSNHVSGNSGYFPPRLKNICRSFFDLYDSLPEIKPTKQVNFDAYLDTPENRDKLRSELTLP
jgi:hypothetical protein